MKKIALENLTIENFKGIDRLSLEANGKDLDILGANASGKTTVVDSFHWLFFDKDSSDRAKFELKPHGKERIDVEVEGTLSVREDDALEPQKVTFKKVYKEKWTKKRGRAKAVFTGHTTKYYLDDEPVKKTEYYRKVKEIFDIEHLKILSDPRYFPEVMHWKARRTLLIETFAEEKIIRQVEDSEKKRKQFAEKKKKINEALAEIPARIDEAARSRPEIGEATASEIKGRIEQLRKELSELQASGHDAVRLEIQKKIASLEEKRTQIIKSAQEEVLLKQRERQKKTKKDRQRLGELKEDLRIQESVLRDTEREIQQIETEIEKIKADFERAKAKKPEPVSFDTCPLCLRPVSPEDKQAILYKAQVAWKEDLLKLKKEAEEKGLVLKTRLKNVTKKKESVLQVLQKLEEEIQDIEKRLEDLPQFEIPEPEKIKGIPDIDVELKALRKKREEENTESDVKHIIEEKEQEISQLQGQLTLLWQAEQADKRIEELRAEERRLAKQYEEIEKQLFQAEEELRENARSLEGVINEHFELARFRLFVEQINGGVQDVCDVLSDKGIPYPDENNATQIALGLDIIKTFSREWGESYPIFLDNRESVTEIPEVPAQVISLYVSPEHKTLAIYEKE